MNARIQLSVALIFIAGATAEARTPMMCTQVAGVVQHKSTGECRSFTNGCQLNSLMTKGFLVAAPDACQNAKEFGATNLVVASADTSLVAPSPSTSTMICEGFSNSVALKSKGHTIRLAVITGRAVATGGALIEVTQASPLAKFEPVAVLATITTVISSGVSRNDGVHYDNKADGFSMFIPEYQPSTPPYVGAIVKLGSTSFSTRCRTLAY